MGVNWLFNTFQRLQTMKFRLIYTSILLALLTNSLASAATINLARWPSISPNGQNMVFSWQGDLWLAPNSVVSDAVRITNHPADETRSAWIRRAKEIFIECPAATRFLAWVAELSG